MTSFRYPQSWHHKTKYIAKEGQMPSPLQQQEQLWTKNFILIAVVNLLISSAGKIVDIVFPFYIHDLGGDNVIVGIASGLCSVFALLMRPIAGWFLDNVSRRSLLIAATIGLIIMPLTFELIPILVVVIALRCVHAFTWAAASTSSNTNACDIIPKSRFGEGMGWFGLTNSLATAAAPAFALFVMYQAGFSRVFIICAAIAVVILILLTQIKFQPIERKQSTARGVPLLVRLGNLFSKDALPAAGFTFLAALPCGAIFTFLALFSEAENIGNAGLFFAIQAVFTGISRILSGKIADTKGEGPFAYTSTFCFIGSIGFLVFGQTAGLFYLAACLMGLGFGLFIPAMQAMAVRIVPITRRGSASSTFLCSWDVAFALGGLLGGLLSEQYGFRAMFAILSIFELIAAAYYFFYARKCPSAFKVYQANLLAKEQAEKKL